MVSPRRRTSHRQLTNWLWGLVFTLPGIVGLLAFTAYPIFSSLYFSFTSYSIIGRYKWVGLLNYERLLTDDPEFYNALYNTVFLVVFGVPLGITVAFLLALLLNQKVKGLAVFRTLFYLPSILPAIASAMLWLWIYHLTNGVFNNILALVGISGPNWVGDPLWAKPSLILMGTWGVGGTMLIQLAGLQDVPQDLYDAAMVDGAGRWAKLVNITIPFVSPYLFFSLVTGLIGGFQYFAPVYIMTAGGPVRSTAVYVFNLWENAFQNLKMGYASAQAWILLIIVAACTALVFGSLARRVYYGGR
ncbi:MAG: sugar ABC transporter permease [Chloroflexi bacterium]|nr:sugar ABC transporter permease [Chloroflexota bacterium]